MMIVIRTIMIVMILVIVMMMAMMIITILGRMIFKSVLYHDEDYSHEIFQ